MKRNLLYLFICAFSAAIFPAITFAAPLSPIVCEDDVALDVIEVESETVECCNAAARFDAAASAVKEAHSLVSEKCAEAGFDLSAIARVCVNFKHINDEKCVAVATVYFTCGCCIVRNPSVDDCKYDEKTCSNDVAVEKFTVGARYECCDGAARWNATYDTMKKAFTEVDDKCSVLRCIGGTGVRGFQIDYGVLDDADGICAVKSTIFYSCCCVCQ